MTSDRGKLAEKVERLEQEVSSLKEALPAGSKTVEIGRRSFLVAVGGAALAGGAAGNVAAQSGSRDESDIESRALIQGNGPPPDPDSGFFDDKVNYQYEYLNLNNGSRWQIETGDSQWGLLPAVNNGLDQIEFSEIPNGGISIAQDPDAGEFVIRGTSQDGDTGRSATLTWSTERLNSNLITDGLLSRWTFEDGSDTTTVVDSQSSHNGTINGASYVSNSHEGGSAIQFDGTDDYVEVDHAYSTFDQSDFTVLGWVYLDGRGDSPGQIPFAGEDGGNSGDADKWWTVQDRTVDGGARRWNIQVDDDTTKLVSGTETSETALDIWYHVAFVHTEGDGYELFVDGASETTLSDNGSIHDSTHSFYMGANGRDGGYFRGTLDDVRVYNRALSQSDIQTIANGDG